MTLDLDTLVLMIGTAAALIAVWLWQRDKSVNFDLIDLVRETESGKLSLFKTGQLVALLTSTWGFIALTRADKLSEFYYLTYMAAWAGANIAKKIIDRKPPKDTQP